MTLQDVAEPRFIGRVEAAYGLSVAPLAFLSLGADPDTATYKVVDEGGVPYFLRLRGGHDSP